MLNARDAYKLTKEIVILKQELAQDIIQKFIENTCEPAIKKQSIKVNFV